ncbi:helix-turn-helix domain-containing protein [Erysipelothrix aquatica]|uniref:helix-turn-helix domain-containing protein n=1 Tax=Erysipelothrix aquatica TaxID=2683714 RepID=UPI001358F1EA|nr:helix-turn-helix transcriptional regulator [Erysipelothrix aquatica]
MTKKLTATERMKLRAMKDADFAKEYDKIDKEVTLAIELQKYRKAQGLTQRDMSVQTGIAQSEISKIETGNGNPTVYTLSKLGEVMGLKLGWNLIND